MDDCNNRRKRQKVTFQDKQGQGNKKQQNCKNSSNSMNGMIRESNDLNQKQKSSNQSLTNQNEMIRENLYGNESQSTLSQSKNQQDQQPHSQNSDQELTFSKKVRFSDQLEVQSQDRLSLNSESSSNSGKKREIKSVMKQEQKSQRNQVSFQEPSQLNEKEMIQPRNTLRESQQSNAQNQIQEVSVQIDTSTNKNQVQQQQQEEEVQLELETQNLIKELEQKLSHYQKAMFDNTKAIEEVQCSICIDMIIGCRVAICGHTFCNQCLTECLIRKKICPQCRKDIRKSPMQRNKMIDSLIKSVIQSRYYASDCKDQEGEYQRYIDRVKSYKDWKLKHKLQGKLIKAGDKIDVRDTEYVWCVGIIQYKISVTNSKFPLLYIHYDGWNKKYDEYLYSNSMRVAPLQTYTSRPDIPRYYMVPRNNMMYARIIENQAELAQLQAAEQQNQDLESEEDIEEQEFEEDEEAQAADAQVQEQEQQQQVEQQIPHVPIQNQNQQLNNQQEQFSNNSISQQQNVLSQVDDLLNRNPNILEDADVVSVPPQPPNSQPIINELMQDFIPPNNRQESHVQNNELVNSSVQNQPESQQSQQQANLINQIDSVREQSNQVNHLRGEVARMTQQVRDQMSQLNRIQSERESLSQRLRVLNSPIHGSTGLQELRAESRNRPFNVYFSENRQNDPLYRSTQRMQQRDNRFNSLQNNDRNFSSDNQHDQVRRNTNRNAYQNAQSSLTSTRTQQLLGNRQLSRSEIMRNNITQNRAVPSQSQNLPGLAITSQQGLNISTASTLNTTSQSQLQAISNPRQQLQPLTNTSSVMRQIEAGIDRIQNIVDHIRTRSDSRYPSQSQQPLNTAQLDISQQSIQSSSSTPANNSQNTIQNSSSNRARSDGANAQNSNQSNQQE
eukprot:403357159